MKKINKIFLSIIIVITHLKTFANNDTLKRNAIYLNATKCIADDILSSGNTYRVLGYFHSFNNFRIDLGGGPIVYPKSNGDILGINVEEMKGVYMAFEIDKIF